jgi:type II secretory pathway component PulF
VEDERAGVRQGDEAESLGQFARTLSTLLENGVPVLTALKITEQVMPNRMIKEAIARTRDA